MGNDVIMMMMIMIIMIIMIMIMTIVTFIHNNINNNINNNDKNNTDDMIIIITAKSLHEIMFTSILIFYYQHIHIWITST